MSVGVVRERPLNVKRAGQGFRERRILDRPAGPLPSSVIAILPPENGLEEGHGGEIVRCDKVGRILAAIQGVTALVAKGRS